MIVDTTVLIDLEREIATRKAGPAMEFLAGHLAHTMRISFIALGEIAEGHEDPENPGLEELLAPYEIVDITRAAGKRYSAISWTLRSTGSRWGDNDLWNGATALEVGEPLVTRDQDHFARIAGLSVLGY